MKRFWELSVLFAVLSLCAGPVAPEDPSAARPDGAFVRAVKPSAKFCTLQFRIDETVKPGWTLTFEYRASSPTPYLVAACVGVKSSQMTYTPLPAASVWTEAVIPLDGLAFTGKENGKVEAGTRLRRLTIYAKNTGSPDAGGELKLELRNIRLGVRKTVRAEDFVFPHTVGGQDLLDDPGLQEASVRDGVFSATSRKPERYNTLTFRLNVPFRPELVCEFEYRVKPNGANLAYVGVNFRRTGGADTFHQFPCQTGWSRAVIRFAPLRMLKKGESFPRMLIYAKAADGPLTGMPTVEVRNIRFTLDPNYDPLAGVRVSYSSRVLLDWPAQKNAAAYRVEVNGRTFEVKNAFFVPDAPLAPGVAKYAVTALPSGKPVAADLVIVPEHNLVWKLPDYDFGAFAAKPHPRFRELAEKFWQPSAEEIRKNAQTYASYRVPPEPTPYKPGADPAITSRIVWHGKIAGGVTARTGDQLLCLARAAILTGDPELKKTAREKLLAVIRWDPDGASGKRHGDLQAAWLLRGICWSYDAVYDLLSPEERRAAETCIRRRGDQFYAVCHPFRGNEAQNHSWDWAEAAGLAALTLAEAPGMETRYRFLASLYAYRFFPSLGFEGENNEGLSYWSYGLGLAIRFVDEARYTVGLNFYEQPWLRQTVRFPMYCIPPRGFSVSFADSGMPNHSGPARASLNPPFTGKLAESAADPQALWYAGRPASADGVRAVIPLDIAQSRHYRHIGLTVFNTFLPDGRENVQVGFHSGKYFAGHQHADQNHFVINAYGDKLAIDGGYYDWWGSKHFMQYSVQTVAHNTVLADGKGQDWMVSGSDGVTTHYFDTANFGFVSGDAKKVYQRRVSRFDRDLLFVKPDYVFVFDRLAAPKPTRFSWLMHAHTDAPMAHDGPRFAIARPLAGLAGSVLLPRDALVQVGPAYTSVPVQGYSDTPVENRQKEWLFSATDAAPVKKTEFLTAMRISRGPGAKVEKRWTLEENSGAVLVKGADVEVLFSRDPGKTVELGKFSTDARCAAVILADGKAADWVKIGGTGLTYGGIRLCEEAGDRFGLKREIIRAADTLEFCGKAVPVTRHTVKFALGRKVYVVEGILDVPETGEYTLESETPVHYIAAQFPRGGHSAQKAGPGVPAKLCLIPGKLIFCVSADRPIGRIKLKK